MKIKYNKKKDILVVTFTKNPIFESDEERPGVIFDYDENGGIVSIEILDASENVSNPERIELEATEGVPVSPTTT